MEKYIGENKILTIQDLPEKTPIGSEVVLVTFENGKTRKMPKALAERMQTDLPIDLGQLRSRWVDPLINQIIVLMQENDIRMEDMDYMTTMLLTSIDDKCNRANAHLYEVEFYPQRTMLSVERVLKDAAINKILDNDTTEQG